jgi:hypothetical protein
MRSRKVAPRQFSAVKAMCALLKVRKRASKLWRLGLHIRKACPAPACPWARVLKFAKQKVALFLRLFPVGHGTEKTRAHRPKENKPSARQRPATATAAVSERTALRLAIARRKTRPSSVSRPCEQLPEASPSTCAGAPELAHSFAVETAHAPLTIEGTKAFCDS